MKRVYISGPLTSSGNILTNIRKAADAGTAVQDAGHAAYIPHLNAFWEIIHQRPYEYWMMGDLAWVRACDALIRLPGESKGADREVAEASLYGIPCFNSVAEFLETDMIEQTAMMEPKRCHT